MIDLVKDEKERAIVVGLVTRNLRKGQAEEYLDELALLADTAGAVVVHRILQERGKIDPAFYIGKGKVEQIAQVVEDDNIASVIFDDDLSPAQVRNLEIAVNRKILDRSGLILDIFASRARSNEAKTQVELAQLQYLLPRLTRAWTHLSKQFGGIGTKGPGETQIETDRRMIRERISHLQAKLERIGRQRETRRGGRKNFVSVSLVGYTNAGKSTLLNALTDADVFVENRLFATLDTTTRAAALSSSTTVLLSDTVGFIRKLPHHLIASFKGTLEEVLEADILLHVIDICHPGFNDQIRVVNATLEELGATGKPTIFVFNKIDALEDREHLQELQAQFTPSVIVSAERGINLIGLKEMILETINKSRIPLSFSIDHSEHRTLSIIHDLAEIEAKTYEDEKVLVKALVSPRNLDRLKEILSRANAKILAEK
ncbi:MAG TPA: GTPase HflX [Bacteroidota bacterium]|nr:GTPase HflX [Bacteroidota bacterium]